MLSEYARELEIEVRKASDEKAIDKLARRVNIEYDVQEISVVERDHLLSLLDEVRQTQ